MTDTAPDRPLHGLPSALDAVADPDSWDLPSRWPARAVDVFLEVVDEQPDLAGAALGSLFQACDLVATAEALDEVSAAAGYVSTGSTGQITAHPATIESRLARTAAANVLKSLRPDAPGRRTAKARHAARVRHGSR